MNSAVFIMLLFACDCDASQCRYLNTASPTWTSVEQCEASMGTQIARAAIASPTIQAQCVAQDSQEVSSLGTGGLVNAPSGPQTVVSSKQIAAPSSSADDNSQLANAPAHDRPQGRLSQALGFATGLLRRLGKDVIDLG